ncbi:MAG: squalene synthase HpnC [Pirellulales bacterium]|nr:squalene synthase HpnC [Pirellulales bacterium]
MTDSAKFMDELARHGPRQETFAGGLPQAFTYCRQLASRHYENFAVLSWLLPRELREPFAALYAYCRWADDLADETGNFGKSKELLDWWRQETIRCHAGEKAGHPILVALQTVISRHQLPLRPFLDLLTAFQQDQNRKRYDSFNQLQSYCRGSADPVGRLVLGLFGYHAGSAEYAEREELSDHICTGLQLANFCQDVGSDYHQRGRIYLPRDSWKMCDVTEADFSATISSYNLRELVDFETSRAKAFLYGGWPLVGLLPRPYARVIDAIVRGGLAICEAIARQKYDVLVRRPRLSRWTKGAILCQAWLNAGRWNQDSAYEALDRELLASLDTMSLELQAINSAAEREEWKKSAQRKIDVEWDR